MELQVPSIRRSLIAGMAYAARWCFSTNPESMNKSEDPESTRDISRVSGMVSDMTGIMRVSGLRSGNGGVEGDNSLCTS